MLVVGFHQSARHTGARKVRRKRTKTRRILLGFLFLLGAPRLLTLYIGLPMVVVGQLINLLTYGVLTKRDTLVTMGPYAWCRNPFYVGTLMTDLGFVVCCDPTRPFTLTILLGYAAVQGTFYYHQMLKEEKLLLGIHGEAYEAYRRRVRWRLLPSPIAALKNGGFSFKWSGRLALHNKIFSRALSAGFWLIAFWALSIATGNGQSYVLAFDVDYKPVFTNLWLMLAAAAVTAVYILLRILEWKNRKREELQKTTKEEVESDTGIDTDPARISET